MEEKESHVNDVVPLWKKKWWEAGGPIIVQTVKGFNKRIKMN